VAGLVVQPAPSAQGLGFFPCHERGAVSGSDEWQVESAGDSEFEREPVWSSIGAGECGPVGVGEQRREGDGVRVADHGEQARFSPPDSRFWLGTVAGLIRDNQIWRRIDAVQPARWLSSPDGFRG
jgi:hypothetical protein